MGPDYEDSDGDGLPNWLEEWLGSVPWNPDSDYDGLSDSFELWTSNTSPINWDSDSDGFSDHDAYYGCWNVNHQTAGYGVTVYDWDGDGLYNPDDAFPFDPNNGSTPWVDSDGDGIPDHEDAWPNDPYNGNPPPPPDSDGDGIPDHEDAWPNDPYNGNPPPPPDSDGDGIPDDQDAWPNDPYNGNPPPTDPDTDGDGEPNSTDTHPDNSALWNDHNGDGINDHEEPPPDPYDPWTADSDGDGTVDYSDSHPGDSNLWCDWNLNGFNDDIENTDNDGDGYIYMEDSHPDDEGLWSDWDRDELNEEDELIHGTFPWTSDTDGDGLSDGEEVKFTGTDPKKRDTDEDGLTDFEEVRMVSHHSNPANPSTKLRSSPHDRYSLSSALGWGTRYTDWQLFDSVIGPQGVEAPRDTDGDGIPDRIESLYAPMLDKLNPVDAGGDADGDGITNLAAYQQGKAIFAAICPTDVDGDGIENTWEDTYSPPMSKYSAEDATADPDGDDLMNFQEASIPGFHPGMAESKYAGLPDRISYLWIKVKQDIERVEWLDVENPSSTALPQALYPFLGQLAQHGNAAMLEWTTQADADNDGKPDGLAAFISHVNSTLPSFFLPRRVLPGDYDGDGMPDIWEWKYRAKLNPASDADAGPSAGLLPSSGQGTLEDADGDRLSNLREYQLGTHPLLADSDGDGWSDGDEVAMNWNPLAKEEKDKPLPDDLTPSILDQGSLSPGWNPNFYIATENTPPIQIVVNGTQNEMVNTSMGEVETEGHRHKLECDCIDHFAHTMTISEKIPDKPQDIPVGAPVGVPSSTSISSLPFTLKDHVKTTSEVTDPWHEVHPGEEIQNYSYSEQIGGYYEYHEELDINTGEWIEVATWIESGSIEHSGKLTMYRLIRNSKKKVTETEWDGNVSIKLKTQGTNTSAHATFEYIFPLDIYQIDEDEIEVFQHREFITVTIYAGQSESQPYEVIPPEGHVYAVGGVIDIREIPPEFDSFMTSASDASGPKYRRISLQGYPLSDSPPAVRPDAVENSDDTYIDALGMELRHGVHDVKVALGSSLLNLSVKRELKHESWTMQSDIPPNERPDRPFGAGWQSNLAANILVKEVQPHHGAAKISAVVIDEEGATHSFSRISQNWVQSLTETNLSKVRQNILADVNGPEGLSEMTYVKRNGTTCHYQKTPITQTVYIDGSYTVHQWYRLSHATDRWNNTLIYDYPHSETLIPNRIYRSGSPQQAISIKQSTDGKRVAEVQGPDGRRVTYEYDTAPLEVAAGSHAQTPEQTVLISVTQKSVSGGDDLCTAYEFVVRKEIDPTPAPSSWQDFYYPHLHLIPLAITDARNNRYEFENAFNSKVINSATEGNYYRYEYWDIGVGAGPGGNSVNVNNGVRAQLGLPPMVTEVRIKSPTDATLSTAFFSVDKHIRPSAWGGYSYVVAENIDHCRASSRSLASDGTEYEWQFSTPFLATAVENLQFNGGTGVNPQRSLTLFFEKLKVVSPAGFEEYEFDFGADMEVKKVRDMSGNVTQYEYDHDAKGGLEAQNTITEESLFYYVFRGANGTTREVHYAASQPTAVIDALGRRTEFTYADDTLELKTTTSPAQVRTEYELQPVTGLRLGTKVFNAANVMVQQTSLQYQNAKFKGFPTREVQHELSGSGLADQVTEFFADELGRVKVRQQPVGGQLIQTIEGYTLANQPRWKMDANGHLTEWQYDALGRLNKMLLPDCGDGRKEVSYVFDAAGNLTRKTDENGVVTFHDYDCLNRRTKTTLDLDRDGVADVRNEDVVTEWTYYPNNQVSTVTDPREVVNSMNYDAIGRLVTETAAYGTVQAATTSYVYGTNSGGSVFDRGGFKPTQVTDPAGRVTTTVYDDLYRVVSVTVPDGGTTTTAYDAAGNPEVVTDALNQVTTTTFDALNRPTSVLYADETETTTRYTSQGWVYEAVDELGRVTTTVYDTAGRKTAVLQPETDNGTGTQTRARPTTWYEYDLVGNVTKVTDPLGHVTDTTYDARNRAVLVMAPPVFDPVTGTSARPSAVSRYDGVGNVVKTIDPLGNETDQVYDAANRLVEKLGPPVPVAGLSGLHRPLTVTTYDANGNVLTVTDPNLTVTTNTYDAHNRLSSTTDGADITVGFGYDAVGNRISVTDGKQQTTTFTYDGQKRLLTETGPGNHLLVTNTYNALNKTSRLDAKGVLTEYFYDERHRLETVVYPGSGKSRAYAYDAAGRITGVGESGDALSAVGYAYDELGRVVAETSQGVVHTHAYDLAGKEVRRKNLGTGRTQVRGYDGAGRLISLAEGGRQTSIHYDLAGRVIGRQMGNGNWAGLNYDALGRVLISTTYLNGSQNAGQILFEHEWDYDLAGNVKEQREIWPGAVGRAGGVRTTAMVYDGAYRLTQETVTEPGGGGTTVTEYEYDDANNRESKVVTGGSEAGAWSYTSNALNQLTGFERQSGATGPVAVSYTYDANGNRETRVADGVLSDSYGWDDENRLIEVEKGGATHRYEYDYRTRRISREEPASVGGGTQKTAVVFAGGLSVAEYEVGVDVPEVGTLIPTVEYVRGPDLGGGVGGMLYTLRPEGGVLAAKYSYANGRGDVVAQANQGGTVTWTASYEAFGTRKLETGMNADRQRANTKEEDPTGLLNEGFRYRDLETGTWLSRDPAGFVDGPNLYAYVKCNPWTAWDPDGLQSFGTNEHRQLLEQNLDPEELAGYNQRQANGRAAAGALAAGLDAGLSLTPPGTINEVVSGKDATGEKVGWFNRLIAATPFGKLKKAEKVAEVVKHADEAQDLVKTTSKASEGVVDAVKKTDYSHIADPKNVNASTKPTPRQVREMKEANRAQNGGTLRDDVTGEEMVDSAKSQRGVTPPSNEVQVDHIIPVDAGGTRTQTNLELRTRHNNREKSNKTP